MHVSLTSDAGKVTVVLRLAHVKTIQQVREEHQVATTVALDAFLTRQSSTARNTPVTSGYALQALGFADIAPAVALDLTVSYLQILHPMQPTLGDRNRMQVQPVSISARCA